jgi:hypothetical protein
MQNHLKRCKVDQNIFELAARLISKIMNYARDNIAEQDTLVFIGKP